MNQRALCLPNAGGQSAALRRGGYFFLDFGGFAVFYNRYQKMEDSTYEKMASALAALLAMVRCAGRSWWARLPLIQIRFPMKLR